MKFVQRLFMGIGGLAAFGVALTLVSPKAHALVAALVQVANTPANPVPNQDVDFPARHPYQQTCSAAAPDANGSLLCNMPIVPPNTEVVIQSVSMLVEGSPIVSQIQTTGGGVQAGMVIPLVNNIANQPLTLYIDPGTVATCQSLLTKAPGAMGCTITGYTVSLP
jgi:hypothetical protein